MISVDEALGLIAEHKLTLGQEEIVLQEALGRTLAKDVSSRLTQPPADVSVMDGYALRNAKLDEQYEIVGESRAGEPFTGEIGAGEAIRIFTGAYLPAGADRVIMQENVNRDGQGISLKDISGPNFIRARGLDFSKGDILIEKDTKIEPSHIMLMAAAGVSRLEVKSCPRIGILRGGDELVPPGTDPAEGQIMDANGPGLIALLQSWGVETIDLGIAKDDLDDILARIEPELDKLDIIIPIGGASVGDYDYMQSAFEALDFKPIFSKVAVKPGKPTWFSKKGKTYVLGLPGNPSSAWVCTHIFLPALIGKTLKTGVETAYIDIPAGGGREEYLRAIIRSDGAEILPKQDSGLIRPLARANALVRRRAGSDKVQSGDKLEVIYL